MPRFADPLVPGVRLHQASLRLEDHPQIGAVTAVTATGAVVVLDATPGVVWGPMPWPIGSAASLAAAATSGPKPTVGDQCLVAFAATAENTIPVLLAWWR